MRKIVLFIAMSLDGYIADKDGNVDWLEGEDKDAETLDSYSSFIKDVDSVIMGWNTYNQIETELSPGDWVYKDLTSYVITHRKEKSTDNIIFTDKDPRELLKELQETDGKNIWICGGANLANQLIEEDLIDEYYTSIIPTILGSGIRLFDANREIKLKLVMTKSYNGITDLVYTRR